MGIMSPIDAFAADAAASEWAADLTRDGVISPTDYTLLEDSALAALATQGREGAFRELLTRYERPVFSLVYRMVRDRALAEDLAQEAFIRAFSAIASYDSRYKFSNWMFKIANNHTIDHIRKRKLDTVSIEGSPHARTTDEESRTSIVVRSTGQTPLQYVENLELGGQIEQAISALRPEYRSVILLRHVEGHSYEEIAEVLELPLGTVKTYLHRARAELKVRLAEVAGSQ
jgi:RNA polymerase sigma-70 factor, ECF subfamily